MVRCFSAELLHYRESENNHSYQGTGNEALCFVVVFLNLCHYPAIVDYVAEDISQTSAFTV